MSKKISIAFIVLTLGLIAFNEFVLNNVSAHEQNFATTSTTKTTGEAAIGGNFKLIDQDGNKFTQDNLNGKFSLIYFGFTHCPMICPTALSNMSLALKELGDKAKDFQIVFITADPERDSQARMKEFVESFDAPIFGLTGTKQQTDVAANIYKVYAQKLEADKTGNYDISHTSIIYVMDKNGKFVEHFSHESKVGDMVGKLGKL